MRKLFYAVLFLSFFGLLISCAGGGGRASVGVYRHHGPSPWWGSRPYYRDTVIVVPPDGGEGPTPELPIEPEQPVAEQLPEPPMDFPDMGMPDIDIGDFDD